MTDDQRVDMSDLLLYLAHEGLGEEVESWLSPHESNKAVSAEQMLKAMPDELITQVSTELGVTAEQMAADLAAAMPAFIDSLTPEGIMPEDDRIGEVLSGMSQQAG
ncbi:YidB family protein [Kitasatospora purpeofusca]|uniref:YidB family protein n=1 Tax=Kitasatospora purpeofusca TaxID=67352 RepID=UPI0035DA0ECB